MPTAARSLAARFAFFSAPSITSVARAQTSFASCSTHPGLREDLLVLLLVDAHDLPPWSKIMNRVLVVPWSSAPT